VARLGGTERQAARGERLHDRAGQRRIVVPVPRRADALAQLGGDRLDQRGRALGTVGLRHDLDVDAPTVREHRDLRFSSVRNRSSTRRSRSDSPMPTTCSVRV